MTVARIARARVEIIYEGKNITQDIAPDLLSFDYNDGEGGKADDISIKLKNNHGKWSGPWLPGQGDKIQAKIIVEDGGAQRSLNCGSFTIDETGFAWPPATVDIKATSLPTKTEITRTKKSKAWEQVRLSEIARNTADAGGLALVFLPPVDPLYDRRDQRSETDLAFLKRVCDDEGFKLKCTDIQLVIYDPREQDKTDPVVTLQWGVSDIKSASFKGQSHDVYSKCTVEYLDPKTGKVKKHTEQSERIKEGKTKKITKRAADATEAERMAKAGLYEANKGEVTGSISLRGDTRLVSGATVRVVGFGAFDGKYFIKSAKHSVGSGYNTSIDVSTTQGG